MRQIHDGLRPNRAPVTLPLGVGAPEQAANSLMVSGGGLPA